MIIGKSTKRGDEGDHGQNTVFRWRGEVYEARQHTTKHPSAQFRKHT